MIKFLGGPLKEGVHDYLNLELFKKLKSREKFSRRNFYEVRSVLLIQEIDNFQSLFREISVRALPKQLYCRLSIVIILNKLIITYHMINPLMYD